MMTVWWFVSTLLMAGALCFLGRQIENLITRRDKETADHAKCLAHVVSLSSDRIAALVLRNAAEKWDSIEEQANLRTLANERYLPGGPSMPVIWLNQQADLLDPPAVQDKEPVG